MGSHRGPPKFFLFEQSHPLLALRVPIAIFCAPGHSAPDAGGDVFIGDTMNQRVRGGDGNWRRQAGQASDVSML
jgi:hypothetical protein